MLLLQGLWQTATSCHVTQVLLSVGRTSLIVHLDWINPVFSEKMRLHCLLSPVETPHCHPHFLLTVWEKRSLGLFSICTHILGVLPSQQITLGTGLRSKGWFLPVLYLLPCSSAPVCPAGLQTEAPRQTGTVHIELDGLSLSREEIETDYRITVLTISISLPPGNTTKVSDLYRLLSAEYGG